MKHEENDYVNGKENQQQTLIATQELVLDDMSAALARLEDVGVAINPFHWNGWGLRVSD